MLRLIAIRRMLMLMMQILVMIHVLDWRKRMLMRVLWMVVGNRKLWMQRECDMLLMLMRQG